MALLTWLDWFVTLRLHSPVNGVGLRRYTSSPFTSSSRLQTACSTLSVSACRQCVRNLCLLVYITPHTHTHTHTHALLGNIFSDKNLRLKNSAVKNKWRTKVWTYKDIKFVA